MAATKPKRKPGRPPLSEKEKAKRAAAKKPVGRPPLSEEEKAERAAKRAVKKQKEHEAKIEKSRNIRAKERERVKNQTLAKIQKGREKLETWTPPDDNEDKGSNTKILQSALYWRNRPPVNIEDAVELEERINEYFDYCMERDEKPTKAGVRLATGISATSFSAFLNGTRRAGSAQQEILLQAMDVLEYGWESYMLNGKVNPASGIFIGKNQFGYKDQVDIVAAPAQPLGELASAEDIAKKYQAALPKGIDVDFKEVK